MAIDSYKQILFFFLTGAIKITPIDKNIIYLHFISDNNKNGTTLNINNNYCFKYQTVITFNSLL